MPESPPLTRALVGPPGAILLPVSALAGLLLLHDRSVPGGGSFELLFLGLLLAAVVFVVWVPRFCVGLLREDGRPRLARHWARWAATPAMGVAVIVLVLFDVPFTTRFALSEPSLQRFAQTTAEQDQTTAEQDQTTDAQDRWVGLYPLTSAEPIEGGGARFLVSGSGFLDLYGFAWSPEGPPQEESHTGYTHLRGPWYIWQSRW